MAYIEQIEFQTEASVRRAQAKQMGAHNSRMARQTLLIMVIYTLHPKHI